MGGVPAPAPFLSTNTRFAIVSGLLVILVSVIVQRLVFEKLRGKRVNRSAGLEILDPDDGLRSDDDVRFEIVAVHGLGAHPEYTWTHQDRSNRTRVHLLKDLLMEDDRLARARFLHFAYNSDWLVDAPLTTAQEIGHDLATALNRHRRSHRSVPIIFIDHSFGGIVIKEALTSQNAQDILDDTSGIIFLGTPHLGSRMSSLAAILASLTGTLGSNAGLLLSLRSNQPALVDLSKRFLRCLEAKEDRGKKTKVIPFCEQKPTYIFRCLSVGLIVPWESAAFGGINPSQTIEVPKDHSDLNKCKDRDDLLYQELIQRLCMLQPIISPSLNPLQLKIISQLGAESSAIDQYHARDSEADADAEADEEAECLLGTRDEMLQEIRGWIDGEDVSNKHRVYWLQGKAGSGKSTIARTVARELAIRNQLAASFFFKRGEGGRQNAQRLFPTLASQLIARFPEIAEIVEADLNSNPNLLQSSLAIQFGKLIVNPLQTYQRRSLKNPLIIIIDALDECNREDHMASILKLVARPIHARSPSAKVPIVKFFVTSRPFTPSDPDHGYTVEKVRNGLNERRLEEATEDTISRDIKLFLKTRLGRIRDLLQPLPDRGQRSNPEDLDKLNELVRRAVPLFIFAATACRFIRLTNGVGSPRERLKKLLDHRELTGLKQTYLPVLNQLFVEGQDETDRREAIDEYHLIVGSIMIITNPLSIASLASLLDIPSCVIRRKMELLEAAISLPQQDTTPVKVFHESFREFLFSTNSGKFYINQAEAHTSSAARCVHVLKHALRRNMCKLGSPGAPVPDWRNEKLDQYLAPHVQYACVNWVHHLVESRIGIRDGDANHRFLQTHLLFWLEALSLLGRLTDGMPLIEKLQGIIEVEAGVALKALLSDAQRFLTTFHSIIKTAPLQIYDSALAFAPECSLVRQAFNEYPQIKYRRINISAPESDWGPAMQTLNTAGSVAMAFLSSGLFTSIDRNSELRIWDPLSGLCQQEFSVEPLNTLQQAISPSNRFALYDSWRGVEIWDAEQALRLQSMPFFRKVLRLAFRNGDTELAIATYTQYQIWEIGSGRMLRSYTLGNYDHDPDLQQGVFCLSGDGRWLAWSTKGQSCLFDADEWIEHPLQGNSQEWHAFSPDGLHLAALESAYFDSKTNNEITIWDTRLRRQCQSILCQRASRLAFSPKDGILALCQDKPDVITIWNWRRAEQLQVLTLSQLPQRPIFSPSGDLLSFHTRTEIHFWDLTQSFTQRRTSTEDPISSMAFMGNGRLLASWGVRGKVSIWDSEKGDYLGGIVLPSSWDPKSFAVRARARCLVVARAGRDAPAKSSSACLFSFRVIDRPGLREKGAPTEKVLQLPVDEWTGGETISLLEGGVQLKLMSVIKLVLPPPSPGKGRAYGGSSRRDFRKVALTRVPAQYHFRNLARCFDISASGQTVAVGIWSIGLVVCFETRTGDCLDRQLFPSSGWLSWEVRFQAGSNSEVMILDSYLGIFVWNLGNGKASHFRPKDPGWREAVSEAGRTKGASSPYQVSDRGDWIMTGGVEKLFWLPPLDRPGCVAYFESLIAIGCQSGGIMLVTLAPSSEPVPRWGANPYFSVEAFFKSTDGDQGDGDQGDGDQGDGDQGDGDGDGDGDDGSTRVQQLDATRINTVIVQDIALGAISSFGTSATGTSPAQSNQGDLSHAPTS